MTQVNGQTLDTVVDEQPQWLWKEWIGAGTLTWLISDPGIGKSTIAYDIATRVSTDGLMPDGSPCLMPGGVVVIALEESIEQRVAPRMRATGADLSRVYAIKHVHRDNPPPKSPADGFFELPTDLDLLKEKIELVQATLVIVDAWIPAVKASVHNWSAQPASELFMQFSNLAEELGVAVLVINHWRRGTKHASVEDMAGSAELGRRARQALTLERDPTDGTRCILAQIKLSNGAKRANIHLRHDGTHVKYLTGLTQAQAAHQARKEREQASNVILLTMQRNPLRTFHPTELRSLCGTDAWTARNICSELARQGHISDAGRGMYKAIAQAPRNAGRRKP